MPSNEDEMNKLAIQAQLAQQQGQSLSQQLEVMQATITDMNMTIDTLKNLKRAKATSLLPIGSGTYITCQKVDPDSVLLSVGAGVIVAKKTEEAIGMLESRLKTVSDAFNRGQKDLVDLNKRLADLNAKGAALSAQMENVRPA